MKEKVFNEVLERAANVIIVNDDWFNTMGWVWMSATSAQLKKLWIYAIGQGAKVHEEDNGTLLPDEYVQLKNGMRFYNPYRY